MLRISVQTFLSKYVQLTNGYLLVWGLVICDSNRVPLRIPIPFIGGSHRNPNHRAPNKQAKPLADPAESQGPHCLTIQISG